MFIMWIYIHFSSSTNCSVSFYFRYVDDIAMAILSSSYDTILEAFNSFHPRLQFTMETRGNNLNFLDVTIKIVDNTIECDWFHYFFGKILEFPFSAPPHSKTWHHYGHDWLSVSVIALQIPSTKLRISSQHSPKQRLSLELDFWHYKHTTKIFIMSTWIYLWKRKKWSFKYIGLHTLVHSALLTEICY